MKNKILKKIFISATEQSGDNIGNKILKRIQQENSKIIIDGIGGSKMKPLMNNQYFSLKDFKSIGIIEIIFSITKYINIINFLSKQILKNEYDLVITIDSPDFNYPLAKKIKKKGFKGKIIQIVAPTVWAWRQSRAKKFSKVYDEIFTLFKFENKYFEKYNLKSTCIGHPIYYIKNSSNNKFIKNYIAFLPGSRFGEINSLFKYYDIAHNLIFENNKNLKIFIPTLPHLKDKLIQKTKNWKIDTFISDEKKEIENYYSKTKIALVCSGTASIEIAKRKIPQLVIYKLNIFTEIIASFFVKVKYANIINIFENKLIIPELTNSNLKKNIFIKKFNILLNDEKSNKVQIINIENTLNKIQLRNSPDEIIYKSIKNLI